MDRLIQLSVRLVSFFEPIFLYLIQPARHSIILSTVTDLTRSQADRVAENALLRQPLILLHRQINRPAFSLSGRLWLVLLASHVQPWRNVLLILKPDTLLHWHRQGLRRLWKFKSRHRGGRPKRSIDTINLIQHMAKENVLWGAERIRGELLKLEIKVATATIQKYIRQMRPSRAPSQTWSVFLNHHAKDVWACDFLPVIDLFFRQVSLFFLVELSSRRIVHFNATAHPTDAWVRNHYGKPAPLARVRAS